MKNLLIIGFFLIGSVGSAFASIDQMKGFLPDENSLSSGWQVGPMTVKEDVDVSVTKEDPDVVVRQYAATDQNNTKQMLVTLSVFEFSSQSVSKNIHFQYESDLKKQDFEELNISDNSNANCVGFIKDRDRETEGTSVSCNKGPYLIISTVEQTGKIFENGIPISTSKVSAAFAEFVLEKVETKKTIPEWIKNNAIWWADGQIDDNSFVQGIQFLIKNGIIEIPKTQQSSSTVDEIPEWIKNNAEWWGKGQISDDDFVKGLQYMISKGIMKI